MWELDYKESWVLKNWCFWTVMLEKTLESPLDCRDPTSPSSRRSVLSVHWKDWCWSWNSNSLATWWEELTHLQRPWCWERLKVGGEGDYQEWDGWMASPTQWTRVWVNSGSWWWTGKPGVLQFIGSQRVGYNWVNEQQISQSTSEGEEKRDVERKKSDIYITFLILVETFRIAGWRRQEEISCRYQRGQVP